MKKVKITTGGMTSTLSWRSERWVDVPDDWETDLFAAVEAELGKPQEPPVIYVSRSVAEIFDEEMGRLR